MSFIPILQSISHKNHLENGNSVPSKYEIFQQSFTKSISSPSESSQESLLTQVFNSIPEAVTEIKSSKLNKFLITQNIVNSLKCFASNTQRSNTEITLLIILSRILHPYNYAFISDLNQTTILDFINATFRWAYKNNSFNYKELLVRQVHKYIKYICTQYSNQTLTDSHYKIIEMLNELQLSYPIFHSFYYKEFDSWLGSYKIFSNIKDCYDITLQLSAIINWHKFFNDATSFLEQYEWFINIGERIIPTVFNEGHASEYGIEVYMQWGELLNKFISLNEYKIDAGLPSSGDIIPGHNYILIKNEVISYDWTDFSEWDKRTFKGEFNINVLHWYSKEIIELFSLYFQPWINFDNFELQFSIYKMWKTLYFVYSDPAERAKLIKFISANWANLCKKYNELTQWNQSLEAREFAYWIWLNDKENRNYIKSITSSPNNSTNIKESVLLLRDMNITGVGFMTKINVDCSCKKSLYVDMNVGELMFWEFYIEEEYDINVRVFKLEDVGKKKVITEINRVKAVDEEGNQRKNIRLVWLNNDVTRYEIEFDNEYSWFTMKNIHYSWVVLTPA